MLVRLCAEGVQINWSQFLLNESIQDAASTLEEDNPFHYAWLLILISFTIWFEPADYQPFDLHVHVEEKDTRTYGSCKIKIDI